MILISHCARTHQVGFWGGRIDNIHLNISISVHESESGRQDKRGKHCPDHGDLACYPFRIRTRGSFTYQCEATQNEVTRIIKIEMVSLGRKYETDLRQGSPGTMHALRIRVRRAFLEK